MKKIVLLVISLTATLCNAQSSLGMDEFTKILDLYEEEQFEIVVNKLTNHGYNIVSVGKEYTLNEVTYKGEFLLIKERPLYGPFTLKSKWSFKMKEYPSYKETEIEFEFEGSESLYNSIKSFIEENLGPKTTSKYDREVCFDSEEKCAFYIDNTEDYGKDAKVNGNLITVTPRFHILISYTDYSHILEKNNGPPNYSTIQIKGERKHRFVKFPINMTKEEYFKNHAVSSKTIFLPLKKQNNVFVIVISIGGKSLNYILDSGASEISINVSTEKYLNQIGVIRSSDYLASGNYRLADGTSKTYRRVNIPSVKLGDLTIDDVTANIVNDNEPLLLGKSFLDRFTYWKIHNDKQAIELRR